MTNLSKFFFIYIYKTIQKVYEFSLKTSFERYENAIATKKTKKKQKSTFSIKPYSGGWFFLSVDKKQRYLH